MKIWTQLQQLLKTKQPNSECQRIVVESMREPRPTSVLCKLFLLQAFLLLAVLGVGVSVVVIRNQRGPIDFKIAALLGLFLAFIGYWEIRIGRFLYKLVRARVPQARLPWNKSLVAVGNGTIMSLAGLFFGMCAIFDNSADPIFVSAFLVTIGISAIFWGAVDFVSDGFARLRKEFSGTDECEPH